MNAAPMSTETTTPAELGSRWRRQTVLKRDVFSTIERGQFVTDNGEVGAVLRRIDMVSWWTSGISRHFLKREAKALTRARALGVAPELLFSGRRVLVRGWIEALPLHIAKPHGDRAFFRSAKAALHRLHRTGVTHNDLAKEQNWLRTPDGRAAFTDFQLATRFSRRSRLFRLAAYEDLRHLLKHKRRYAPDSLTATERKVLARKSWLTRIWMATGKRVYIAVTRGLFNFTDREGGGTRLVQDAPVVAARLKAHADVSDAVVVAFPDRYDEVGLYAFVESETATEAALIDHVAASLDHAKAPDRLQVVKKLPRLAGGEVRTEILQLIAMNQVDLIDPMIGGESERDIVDRIVAERKNLHDAF